MNSDIINNNTIINEPNFNKKIIINYENKKIFYGHKKVISSIKFSCNGKLFASASADKTARIWNIKDKECLMILQGHSQGISDITWSPKSRYIATASDDHTLKLWDSEIGKDISTFGIPIQHSTGFNPIHYTISKKNKSINYNDQKNIGHTNYVFSCDFNRQSTLLLSGSFDETFRLWDIRTGTNIKTILSHTEPLTCTKFNKDGSLIVTSSYDGLCRIWDTCTGKCLKTMTINDTFINNNNTNIDTNNKKIQANSPIRYPITFANFTPNGKYILFASLDNKIKLWDFEKDKIIKIYKGHKNEKYCNYISTIQINNNYYIISGSEDNGIYLWDIQNQNIIKHIENAHDHTVLALDTYNNNIISASLGNQYTIKLWELL